jgi:hypothetical protein
MSKNYKVTVYQTVQYANTVEIEAESEDHAIELASLSDKLGDVVDIETSEVEVEKSGR